MADADLIQRADLLEIAITRDASAFTDRGVTAPRIALMTDARTAFADFPTDEELLGIVSSKTAEKDAIRTNMEISIRSIRNMADVQYKGAGPTTPLASTTLPTRPTTTCTASPSVWCG